MLEEKTQELMVNMQAVLPLIVTNALSALGAIVILLIGLWLSGKADQLVVRVLSRTPHFDPTLKSFFGSLARYLILTVTLLAVMEEGLFGDPTMKLLLFTEHKDTLDFLAGDGKDGRPYGKLREWGLTLTQIHGGMKIGDRDTPGSRIYAEREFRDPRDAMPIRRGAACEGASRASGDPLDHDGTDGGRLYQLVDLDLQSVEHRIAVAQQRDFGSLNPGFVIA